MQRPRNWASRASVLPSISVRRAVSIIGPLSAAMVLFARPASATDVDFQIAGSAGVSIIRTMPSLKSGAATTFAREVPAHDVPIGGSVTAIGGGFDLSLIIDDRWAIPAFGLGGYGAVGSYPAIVTSIDGSIAHVRPWSTYEIDLLLPGVGYRVKRRRFMFSASVRTGVSVLHVGGSVAGGGDEQPITLSGVSPMLQAELEACRRLDPITRVCVQIAPRIYDFGIMNGATLGLRVEWGR